MTQTTDLATLLVMLAFIAGLSLLLIAAVAAHLVAEGRAPIGTGHHCKPGTCPVCDSFGTWAE